MTPRIMTRDGRRGFAPRRGLTFRMIILWTCALALALVVVSHAQADGVDAATDLQPSYEPIQMPVDEGGELEPEQFCEPQTIPGSHVMAEVWSAEMGQAIGPGSLMPDFANDSDMEDVWSAQMPDENLGWEEGATMPVTLMELPAPDPSPGPICNTVSLK